MEKFLVIISTINFIMFSALVDAEHIKRKHFIKSHTSRVFLRASFIAILFILNPLYGLGGAFLFAAIFDQAINYMLKRRLLYLGTTAKWDRFFNDKPILYITIKSLCFILAIIIMIYA